MPGVPDVYQGTELVDLSLVDPDNRRPVDYEQRIAAAGAAGRRRPARADLADEKLLVTSRALRLRRQNPEAFAGSYRPLPTSNGHAVAFARGDAVITHRDPAAGCSAPAGRLGRQHRRTADGDWQDVLTGRAVGSGAARIHELLADLPVALLARS